MVAQISPELHRTVLGLRVHFKVGQSESVNWVSGGPGKAKG